jgi:hypothetical protein
MQTSSQPEAYLTSSQIEALTSCSGTGVSTDTITIRSIPSLTTSDIITLSNTGAVSGTIGAGTGYYSPGAGSGISSISTTAGTVTINSTFSYSDLKIDLPEEWVNCFPDYDRIQKMCKEYPALKIAYEKFITTYKLVKDHYDTPEDQRPRI